MVAVKQEAPQCAYRGCQNRTWNPSGACYQHVGAGSGDPHWGIPTNVSSLSGQGGYTTDADLVYHQSMEAFPDIDGPIHPSTLREQVAGTLAAAMSIEVYRAFPSTDVPDAMDRMNRLNALHVQLREALTVQPTDVSDEHAAMMASSSDDRYGRGLFENVQLASYGVRKEWELANALGIRHDEYGRRYDVPYPSYCMSVSESLRLLTDQEYADQLTRYEQIIGATSGRPPLCPYPVLAPSDAPTTHTATDASTGPTGQQDPSASPQDDAPSFGRWLWSGTKKAAVAAVIASGDAADNRADRRAEREARVRLRQQDELLKLQLREARKRKGGLF